MKKPHRFRRLNSHGVSLLETLLATFLLTILAVEVAGFFARGRAAILEEGKKRDAVELAQGILERFEVTPLQAIADDTSSVTVDGHSYLVTSRVTTDLPEPGMKNVEVIVDWTTRRGKARSVRVEAAYGFAH
jgi:Tfp pilus assembly protein PilV